ncbi:hypothetical protein [Kitasatospora sp. LaBMicrA B282]|uniref:hypothetical protein n=1 Tax=Kitasatospora sp. LaBMicrA B282 TaxID=3420949 RepID=UPI003D103B32
MSSEVTAVVTAEAPPAATATASAAASAGRLPADLAPWAGGLSALTPALALALGPMVRRIDGLVAEREPRAAELGEPDGYGGLARAGRPDQLLPSQWLLADELPEEFLRRHLSGELLYLAPERRRTSRRGRLAVLVDTGPGAAGAVRLVHLAALVVLHRRAAVRGSELVVGILGDPPGHWLTGELPELLPSWLEARRAVDPDAASVARAHTALDAPDEAWLLTTPALAAELPGHRCTLTAEPGGWSAAGATRVRVTLGPTATELRLPAPEIAVRALRGAEFRRTPEQRAASVDAARLPVFNSLAPALLARGTTTAHLVVTRLSPGHAMQPGRPRTHGFGGPVVAAAQLGRRLIALLARGDRLEVRVIGRPLAPSSWVPVHREWFGLDRGQLDALLERPVLPLTYRDGLLSVPLAGRWWSIAPTGEAADTGPCAAATAGRAGFDWSREPRLYGGELPAAVERADQVVFAQDAVAWTRNGEHWQIRCREGGDAELVVPAGAEVIGLVRQAETVALLTCSAKGLLLRSVRPDGTRTLSSLSGGTSRPVVHPGLPLVATESHAGRTLVGDALTGQIHLRIGRTT